MSIFHTAGKNGLTPKMLMVGSIANCLWKDISSFEP